MSSQLGQSFAFNFGYVLQPFCLLLLSSQSLGVSAVRGAIPTYCLYLICLLTYCP